MKLYIVQPLPEDFSFEKALKEKINIPETYYKKIEYSSMKDLIPFYPYLISLATSNGANTNNSVICLSSESFVDREEKELLEYKLKRLLTVYNRCERKKIEFNVDDAIKEVVWNGWNEKPYRELTERVKKRGKKATIDDIHLEMHEYFRQKLVNEMLKNDLNPADYGYERFIS